MITANDHALRLFNGDIGLCWPDTDGRARVHFPDPTGHSLRAFLPARLPAREPAYALTVHKSQGSEFDTVALVLPDTLSPVLTRELLYTALTRARQGFWLWGSAALITATVERPLRRHSGLARRLGDFGAEIGQAIEPQ
jgi:exodeoxyribonuclease V alpha subunit